jgi:type III secretion protein L
MSNVIKARTMHSANGGPVIVKRSLQLAAKKAEQVVAEARLEASRIIGEARQEAQGILTIAKEQGYDQGVREWHETLSAAWRQRDEYLDANEAAVLKLAVKVAGKVIGEELRTTPETVASLAREALRTLQRAKTFVVQVHPADAPLLNERILVLRSAVGPTRDIEVVSNPSLLRGDCVVESDIGLIDARLETQLKNIERMLTARTSA